LEQWTEARVAHAKRYDTLLTDAKVKTPPRCTEGRHVYHVYALRTPRRDEILAKLNKQGIGAAIHYPVPVHLQQGYAELGYKLGDFPVSEKLGAEELSLPM